MSKQEDKFEIDETALVAQNVFMKGKVKIGKGCIIHPTASINAENGPIVIGDYNIIEEQVLITNKGVKNDSGEVKEEVLVIGSYNHFEIMSTAEVSRIGDCNKFEIKSHIESNVKIGDGCVIGAFGRVPTNTTLDSENSFNIYGKQEKIIDFNRERTKKEVMELRDLLYNKMKISKK